MQEQTAFKLDDPHAPSSTEAPSGNKPEPRRRNRRERRSLIARFLTRFERKLLQLAREKARGSKGRASENTAAFELSEAREALALTELMKAAKKRKAAA